jgi:hypothetical protein
MECTILGPKSLAGLIAYPVVPPKLSPIAHTKIATGKAPIDPNPILASAAAAMCTSGPRGKKSQK